MAITLCPCLDHCSSMKATSPSLHGLSRRDSAYQCRRLSHAYVASLTCFPAELLIKDMQEIVFVIM